MSAQSHRIEASRRLQRAIPPLVGSFFPFSLFFVFSVTYLLQMVLWAACGAGVLAGLFDSSRYAHDMGVAVKARPAEC